LHSFDKAIEISPDDSIAWINRGVTLESIERYEEALESYEKGIELSPDESLPWRNRGGTLLRLQRYKEALESYEKAIELSPDNSVGWKNRGYALYNIERYEEAILSYREAIKLEPQNLSTYIGLGIIYFRQSSIEQAIQQFNRALKIHPKGTSQIWNCLGFIYLVKRKLKEAQTHFRRAAQTEGDHFLPHFNLALVSILQDKKGKKVKDIKRLLQTALDECAGKIIQEKLYIALGTIALGDPKTGLENLKNLLSTIQYPNSTLRGGILESAEIFATRPEHFPGMDQALTLIQQTLTHPTNNKSSKLNTMG
jgi:tetratricopeptide (TPR) repeat protein